MLDEFDGVGSLNFDTDKYDDLLAPKFSNDDDDYLYPCDDTWDFFS